MKKYICLSILTALFLNVSVMQASEPRKEKKARQEAVQQKKENSELSEAEIQNLTARVTAINQMDMKSLTPKEKREIRKELRGIKDKLNTTGNGIYIGGGALLVIIIILLLLL